MSEAMDLEFLILSFVDRSDGPVGSGVLCDFLRQDGNEISEATVGRLLRDLDNRELTERSGFRGRTLTEAGRTRLAQLRRERELALSSTELMRALQPSDIQDVVGVLIARRGLEREAARLAAIYISADDVLALEALIDQYRTAEDPEVSAAADFNFHTRLTEIAGNKVLQAATRLIHDEAQHSMIPEAIRRKIKPMGALQHAEILAALRDHDPDRAEKAMTAHLDFIIEAVQRNGLESNA